MFYYYGRRKQIAHLYPPPRYPLVIEPFAGSAAYSLHHKSPEAILIDTSDDVALVWFYLMTTTARDLMALPSFRRGENLNTFYLSPAQKALIGFHINPGSSTPKLTVTAASRWEAGRRYIVKNLPVIQGWDFYHWDYTSAPDVEATWFIDPPFQQGGQHYQHKVDDYKKLAEWVMTRKGQVIVCEAEPADWLPFKPLGSRVNNGGLNKGKRRRDLVYVR